MEFGRWQILNLIRQPVKDTLAAKDQQRTFIQDAENLLKLIKD